MLQAHLRLANRRRMVAAGEADPARRAGLLEAARRGFARCIELAPRDSRGPHWMGVLLHEEMEKPYEALRFFQRAYALDPVCDAALRNLVQIHAGYPPPPGGSPQTWDAQGAAYAEDLADNAAARLQERNVRSRGPMKDDGCE